MFSGSQPKRILIVRLSSLGDVIQTLSLPTAIRRSFPQAKIGWAIDAELAPAIDGHRDIDCIHPLERNQWQHSGLRPLQWPRMACEMRRFIDEIRLASYDVALDAQGLLISALIPALARIPRRVGFGHRREFSHLFYTEKHVSKGEYFALDRPHSMHMLALARAIGCNTESARAYPPRVPVHQRDRIAALLDAAFADSGPLIALAPGTRWQSKQWPLSYWIELLRRIVSETQANVVLVGTASDEELGGAIIGQVGDNQRARILNLLGMTAVPELYALFAHMDVTIAADTAPLHIAGAAQSAHLIGIYGPTSPKRTGPAGSPDIRLLSTVPPLHCQPCLRARCLYGTNRCMREVGPAQVFAALSAALAAAAVGSSDRNQTA